MASHYQTSPSSALHLQHGQQPPPPHLQTNGHPQLPIHAQIPQTSTEGLTRMYEEVWLKIGHLFETMTHNGQALESYQRALFHNKNSIEALRAVASILRTEDKYEAAVDYIRTILQLNPADGESWSSLGHCYLMMDELQQAYTAYQSALYNLRDPKEPKLWYGIGILYDRYGSLDHAEEAFCQVMRMAPEFDKANEIYFRLGIIYKQQAKYQQSLECFQYIVKNPPQPLSQTDIWFQIGHVFEQQKDYDSAKNAYLRVLDRDPHHAKVLQQLGWLHHQQSPDYATQEQAIEFLEKSVSSDQTDAQSWYLLGRCYMSQHKFPKAYEAYQQAVYRDGRNPTFWCSIGVLYYQINQYRDALDAYSRAIRLNPNISEVWYDLGTLYESCNNQTSDALDAYERAAQLDPTNTHIKSRLNLLRSGQSGAGQANGAPPGPQDIQPHHYQAAAAAPNGPPAQWGAPTPGQLGPPHHQGPPPPPLQAGPPPRDWTQRIGDMHSSQPPQPQGGHPYDHRDGRGAPLPPRQPTPPYDRMRGQDHRQTPMQRPLSPSPRDRAAVPSLLHAQNGPPPASGPLPGIAQQVPPPMSQNQGPPPGRIPNTNYAHPAMPPMHQGPLSYGRASPAPEIRPILNSQPPSPRSGYPFQTTPHQPHRAAPAGFGPINNGPSAPSPAMHAVDGFRDRERERERERDREREREMERERERERERGRGLEREREFAEQRERERERSAVPPVPKRSREWEDREESHKKSATDENRARLDEIGRRDATPVINIPSIGRDGFERERPPPFATPSHFERQDRDRVPIGGPPRPGSAMASQPPSPAAARRAEEVRRANDTYKPSEAAHHPAPLSTVLHQEHQRHQGPPSHAATPQMQPQQLYGPTSGHPTPQPQQQHLPPPPAPAREQRPESARPEQQQQTLQHLPPINIAPKREAEPDKMDVDDDHRRRMEAQQRQEEQSRAVEQPKRPEEPAARKMSVDENYDDEESEKGSVKGAAASMADGSAKSSPKAGVLNGQQNGLTV